MLPVLHPLEKTRIELKRGITRVELFVKLNNDDKGREVLKLLRNALEIIENIEE
ncbi:hypothetical protein UFOVP453_19 [uncultured Caudovirales phage]|uniref:Uncharacterized protein n=1 Tax=uncultured Caudovirales phage TaxID=2100421 RepID=A0A6J5MBV7_9CAUD|nr:hypothetical protein UFOVP453_19 [uncultured Caudovirales phage]